MRSSSLCWRGAFGPAIVAAALCAAACAVAADLQLDLTRPVPLAQYESKLRALEACEAGSLAIAYSFGHLQITALATKTTCRVEVSVEGELGETGELQRFRCDGVVISQIDWLKDATGQRESPPLQELRKQRGCQAHTG
jgi:hypothetical protein